jgi:hypothetical protein
MLGRPAELSPGVVGSSEELAVAIAGFRDDPLGFVRFIFPWGIVGGPLENETGPDEWQEERLRRLGDAVAARRVGVPGGEDLGAYLAATATGHGVGKTTLVAWVIIWFMSVHSNCAVKVTASKLDQLIETTWRELGVWHERALNSDWFVWSRRGFYMKGRASKWSARAVAWSAERSQGFAGTHAPDTLMIFDEASEIDDKIWEVAEGALTTENSVWLVFGNPTKNVGRFRECWRQFRHRWDTMEVDARTAKAVKNKAFLNQQVEDYGEDSDIVRVRIRGMFPQQSNRQLISEDVIQAAVREFDRRYGRDQIGKALQAGPVGVAKFEFAAEPDEPWILSVDVARFGSDKSVILLRVGKTAMVLAKFSGLNGVQLAYRVAEWIVALKPDVVFLDNVGVGVSAYDQLEVLGYEVVGVNGGIDAIDKRKYRNRRTEMWFSGNEWLIGGGMILHDQELVSDLSAPEYGYEPRTNRQFLETKDDMRARNLPSPDCGDALCQSFYMPVPRSQRRVNQSERLANMMARMQSSGGGHSGTSWMSF